jgi:hypothetical protein
VDGVDHEPVGHLLDPVAGQPVGRQREPYGVVPQESATMSSGYSSGLAGDGMPGSASYCAGVERRSESHRLRHDWPTSLPASTCL